MDFVFVVAILIKFPRSPVAVGVFDDAGERGSFVIKKNKISQKGYLICDEKSNISLIFSCYLRLVWYSIFLTGFSVPTEYRRVSYREPQSEEYILILWFVRGEYWSLWAYGGDCIARSYVSYRPSERGISHQSADQMALLSKKSHPPHSRVSTHLTRYRSVRRGFLSPMPWENSKSFFLFLQRVTGWYRWYFLMDTVVWVIVRFLWSASDSSWGWEMIGLSSDEYDVRVYRSRSDLWEYGGINRS